VDIWAHRLAGARFRHQDFSTTLAEARRGDLVYCDPPYSDSQSILYGAQSFRLERLFEAVADCKARGVRVALSIDGSKKSGAHDCQIDIPQGLFERECVVNTGRSMLRRFQMAGQTLENEQVHDRLLLTF
jgi:DNA adenine methylase